MSELSVIIVNYNDKSHLEKCIRSLEETGKNRIDEIIVVDNNSTDGSQEFILRNFSGVELISNIRNIGYPMANNQGIEKSTGRFILFLNPDTVVHPESLDLLLEEIKTNPYAGAVGPALLQGEKRYQISFGGARDFFSEIFQKCVLNFYYKFRLKFSRRKMEVNWVGGACLLTRRDVLVEAGLFDENFFLYFEDIDLCYRIRENGWKIIYLPLAEINHVGGASTGSRKLFSRYFYRKSQLYFYKKHNSRSSLFLLRLYLRISFSFLVFKGFVKKEKDLGERRKFFKLLTK